MLKLSIKSLFKKENSDSVSEQCRRLILKLIEDKRFFRTHKILFAQLSDYYKRKGLFTDTQLTGLQRLSNG